MKKYFITLMAVLACISLFGQKWTLSYTIPGNNKTAVIAAPFISTVIVATNKGIYRSTDTGTTWNKVSSEDSVTVLECKGNNCYAMTKYNIYKSTDAGASWNTIAKSPLRGTNYFNLIRVWDANKIVANIYYDSVAVSYDGGATWQRGKYNCYNTRLMITDNTFIEMVLGSQVKISTNGGKTLTNVNLSYQYDKYSHWQFLDSNIAFLAQTNWAVDLGYFTSQIKKTTNGGQKWWGYSNNPYVFEYFVLDAPSVWESFASMSFINEKYGWVAGIFNKTVDTCNLMHTQDSGKTWQEDTLGWKALGFSNMDIYRLKDMEMLTPGLGWGAHIKDTTIKILKYFGAPCAGFTAGFNSSQSGMSVIFSNSSTANANKFSWKFGDGNTSTAKNPTYTYSSAGSYTVCLISRDSVNNCIDSVCKNISVSNPCAGFAAGFIDSAKAGMSIKFTSTSSGNANKFIWKFGDGNTSTTKNPINNYASAGTYTVCLTIRDTVNNCLDSLCKNITVVNPCTGFAANFSTVQSGLSVIFSNTTSAGANKFNWKFGDGNTSTTKNPTHTYLTAGTYTACLIAWDTVNNCLDSICNNIIVTNPCAGFAANFIDSAMAGNSVKFTSTSSGNANKFNWKFGDGDSSAIKNPTHTYSTAGTYNVCLIARDSVNSCLDVLCRNIVAGPNSVYEASYPAVSVYPNPSQNGLFNIQYNENFPIVKLKVLDISGREIKQLGTTTIDLSAEKGGIYLLEIETKGGNKTYIKLLKQ